MNTSAFTTKILDWYQENKRDLPWRRTRDPFKIWLSEVIMQQTRVNQGTPYYLKFDQRFQTVSDLASVSEEEVLQLWQGLGYYSRGRNLLEGARVILHQYGGKMPPSYEDLLKIKGIGKYTAAAIASIAYKEPVACVDGNVYRVLSRVFGVKENIAYASGQKAIQALADELVYDSEPGDYNQAVMEFGALHCTPKNPLCEDCIFQEECIARNEGQPEKYPVKSKKVKKTDRFLHYLLFQYENQLAMRLRRSRGIWEGLYDFYSLPENGALRDEAATMTELKQILGWTPIYISSRDYRHILSHQTIYCRVTRLSLQNREQFESVIQTTQTSFFRLNEVEKLPKPVLINKYLNDEIF